MGRAGAVGAGGSGGSVMSAGAADGTRGRRGPGRPRVDFEPLLKTEILDLLAIGVGRRAACARLGIGYNRFLRNLHDDPQFAEQVTMLEEKRAEDCVGLLYQMAVGSYGPDHRMRAAIAYLARVDRVEAIQHAREAAARGAEGSRAP